jgi:uncharacterized protein
MARLTAFGAATVVAAALSWAAPVAGQSFPALTRPVNDLAGVIDAASAAELDRRIRALYAATGDSLVVATVDTYQPLGSIEEYAVRLFERAGIGDKDTDSGVLIVVAVEDRAVRIEVGYGLEGFITDGFAGETIRAAMLPSFRAGRYGEGLVAGATRLIQRIAEGRGVTVDAVPAAQPVKRGLPAWQVLALLGVGFVILLIVVGSLVRRFGGGPPRPRRRRSTWSGWHGGIGGFGGGRFGGGFGGFGGGSGGGFGGFGGGMSGGGGASGRW